MRRRFVNIPGIKKPYKIGDPLYGGLIFYISDGGKRGLITSTLDEDVTNIWGCSGTAIPGADEKYAIYEGSDNTDAILDLCSSSSAAQRCRDVGSEWFLPSLDEMRELRKVWHDELFTEIALVEGYRYWTSSDNWANGAWAVNATSSGFYGAYLKTETYHVRPIREFNFL